MDSCGWPIAGGDSSTPVVGDRSICQAVVVSWGVRSQSSSRPPELSGRRLGQSPRHRSYFPNPKGVAYPGHEKWPIRLCSATCFACSGGMLGKPREPGVDASVYYGVVCPCCRLTRPVSGAGVDWVGCPCQSCPTVSCPGSVLPLGCSVDSRHPWNGVSSGRGMSKSAALRCRPPAFCPSPH